MVDSTDPTALTYALAALRSAAPSASSSAGGAASTVSVSNFPATQAVTGTVTANAGTGTMAVSAVSLPLPSGAATDGADISTPTAMPAGGVGIRGWLSAIWTKLNGTLAVTGTFWQATQPVSGTFWQATQPVSLATNTPDVTDRAARLLGHVTVDTAPTTAVTGTFWQATQPVSLATNTPDVTDRAARLLGHVTVDTAPTTTVTGTVTGNQGTAAAVGSAWPMKNTDGTNTAAVKAASTAATPTDPALVVTLSPNNPPAATNPAATWRLFATGAAAAAGTVTQAAAGAGVKNYLAGFTVSYNGAVITAGTTIQVKDNVTVIYEEYFPQSTATAGSVNRCFAAPLAGTANTALTVNVSAGVTSVTQKVAAWGYTGP